MLFRTRFTYGKRDVWSDLLAWTPSGTVKTRGRLILPAHSLPDASA